MEMTAENKELFDSFKIIHDNYVINSDAWMEKFNAVGKEVVEVMRIWERKLCSHSERGQYGIFSSKLSDKFWDEIRKVYPKIDYVGVT
ncbi:hypothetical protein A3D77_07820 [Candidatus Gottesmanbacteria bacterium RIFCSPHIGHO2_02_FULL_39_11]|uniref:Uncharacterized protein n=1 Tax=Candidatus Gottesmanbacteria bacterium RIFCSPHIGHO2_02_FULL_39_11 TaxID=1798382 RepID=A0A1F5ZSI5_9BACT|nr:MAG: hypothetical protein A3D77_07820 [Candidatus Gottesmanbacteria bacterium RIFCSPHIGHO2_02_FULL_39_11]